MAPIIIFSFPVNFFSLNDTVTLDLLETRKEERSSGVRGGGEGGDSRECTAVHNSSTSAVGSGRSVERKKKKGKNATEHGSARKEVLGVKDRERSYRWLLTRTIQLAQEAVLVGVVEGEGVQRHPEEESFFLS